MFSKPFSLINERTLKFLSIAILAPTIVACSPNEIIHSADNNAVISIGDSIFDENGHIEARLESYAGETFRNYTQTGAELEGGTQAISIYEQYALAKTDDPLISTIVMNGGGNDILIPAISAGDPHNCKNRFGDLGQSCKDLIDQVYIDAVNLLNQMSIDGVEKVIYLGYFHPKRGYLQAQSLKDAVDYAVPLMEFACENSAVDCSFVDSRPVIVNSDIKRDGVHPRESGSIKMADLIWPFLEPALQ